MTEIGFTVPDGAPSVRVVTNSTELASLFPDVPNSLYGGMSTPTGIVTLEIDSTGELLYIVCACGNLTDGVGFIGSDPAGVEVPHNSREWIGHYACPECGLVIDTLTHSAAYRADWPHFN